MYHDESKKFGFRYVRVTKFQALHRIVDASRLQQVRVQNGKR